MLGAAALACLVLSAAACSSPATQAPLESTPTEPAPEQPQPPEPEPSPGQPATLAKSPSEVCTHGVWIPGVQEPESYVTCTADAECGRVVIEGCCSRSYAALRTDRACYTSLGVECDMVCDKIGEYPPGGAAMEAACVEGRCTLRPGASP